MNQHKTILLLVALLCNSLIWAQPGTGGPASFDEANSLMEEKLWDQAVIEWEKLLAKEPLNANWHYKMGVCLLQTKDKKDALQHLETACGSGKFANQNNYDPYDDSEELAPIEALSYLGQAQHLNNEVENALETYALLEQKVKNPKHILLENMTRQKEQCEEAKLQLKAPKDHKIENVGNAINSEYKDYNAVAPRDFSVVYFSSNRYRDEPSNEREVDPQTMEYLDDVYMSFRGASGKYGPAEFVPGLNLNNESARVMGISPDGKIIYLARGPREDCEFMMSYQIGESWTAAIPFGASINSQYPEKDFTVAPDGKTIYFSSIRPEGKGGYDLYKCEMDKDGNWGEATNLGDLINTQYNEITPSLGNNGTVLYFSSDGHNTMGGFDIFLSTLDKKSGFGNAMNAGYPLSTTDNDYFFQAVPVSRKGFISSSKIGGSGLLDIYEVRLARNPNEVPVLLKGSLTTLTAAGIPAGIKALAKAIDENISLEAEIAPSSGMYELKLPPCGNYQVKLTQGNAVLKEYEVETACDNSIKEIYHETYYVPVRKMAPVNPDDLVASAKAKEKADKEREKKEQDRVEKAAKEKEKVAKKKEKEVAAGKAPRQPKPKPEGPIKRIGPSQYNFTYGVFKVKMDDVDAFVQNTSKMIEERGLTTIHIYASSSKVPRSNKRSNQELSEDRALATLELIKRELEKRGYEEGVDFVFGRITAGVNGKEFENDAKEKKEEYEKHQYVELIAEG